MRRTLAVVVLAAVVFVIQPWAPLSASTGPIPLKCDRACLEKVMDDYLAAVVAHDPKRVPLSADVGRGGNGTGTYPFTPDCHRIENGSPTTNVPRPATAKPGDINPFWIDCMTGFRMGFYYVVQNVHGRRYPLVDLERGVVWAHCVFDQGTVNSGVLSDGTKHSYAGFNRPSSILVSEAFLLEKDKIKRVEMIGPSAVYHMNSPWGGLSGN